MTAPSLNHCLKSWDHYTAPRCNAPVTTEYNGMLSCRDLVEIMRHHRLPTKIVPDEDLAKSIIDRHQRRRQAMESAYRTQAAMLSASD